MEPSPYPKAKRSSVKNFRMFYGIQRFIATFTRARHLSLSWVRSVQSSASQPIAFKPVLILSTAHCYFPVLRLSKGSVEVQLVSLLAVRDCLFSIFADNVHISRPWYLQTEDVVCYGGKGPGWRDTGENLRYWDKNLSKLLFVKNRSPCGPGGHRTRTSAVRGLWLPPAPWYGI